MKRLRHKLLSLILASAMLLAIIPAPVFAAESEMVLRVSQVSAVAGSTVQVKLELENNPGLAALKVKVAFDDVLTLTDVAFNSGMGGQYQNPQTYASPVSLTWYNGAENFTGKNTTFATLTFQVSESATAGEVVDLVVTYNPSDVYDITETDIALNVINGSVTVLDCVPGDINGDGVTNLKDLSRLFQYLADWDVIVNEPALDTNGDGSVNLKDQSRLFQYLADWDVELYPKVNKACDHVLTAVEAKAATCEAEGNTAYWHCGECNGYFSDADATTKIQQADTIKAKLPHTEVSFSEPGCLDGVKCSVCGEIIKSATPVDGTTREISYELGNGFSYIEGLVVQNKVTNPNPQYISSTETYVLQNPKVAGFDFLGWYDLPAGTAAENVKKLTPDDGIHTLYAHWAAKEYTIQYKSDLIPVDSAKYTVDTGKVLAVPQLDGYTFAGWSDDDGNVIREIKIGETEHKTYTANWLSDRNQAWAKKKLDDPIVYEDDNVILFAYEIGEVRNVPLYEVHDFGKILSDGVTKEETKTYSSTTSVTQMEAYTSALAKSTTESFSWTLSEGWSDSVSVDSEWLKENEMTEEEAKSVCTNEGENWYISSGSSGTDTKVDLDYTDTYDLKTTTNNTKEYNTTDEETRQDFSAGLELDFSSTSKISANADLGFGVELGASHEFTSSLGLDAKYSNGATTKTKTGTEEDDGENNQDGTIVRSSTENTHTSSWNNESGTSGSKEISEETSVMQSLSEKISQKTGYGKSYIQSGDQSNTQDCTSSSSSNEEYSSSVTFSKIVEESVTKKFTTENTKSGYHRWVIAGTAHVFGVIGYDIATQSYFTYSFSIMDDRTFDYEDYSYNSSDYNDNQRSIIPFEAPDDIVDYVIERVCGSEGLEVSKSGVITAYDGDDLYVTIPEYITLDGVAIKVTSISETAFQNKSMEAIALSDYITEIPDNAFAGCSSLISVEAKNVTSIGDNVFAGCNELKFFTIGKDVSYLGDNAFDSATLLTVETSSPDIVKAAAASGAANIAIYVTDPDEGFDDIELTIPATTESFLFNGDDETFDNFYIVSEAEKTLIANATFNSDGKAPLDISSADVVLREVKASAASIALICRADQTTISLYGESNIETQADNAMLCKALALEQNKTGYYSHLTTDGNLLVQNGAIEGASLLTVNGAIVPISAEQFDNYAVGIYTITFDANSGVLEDSESAKSVVFGQLYGSLPVPTREYYTFDGWYTAKTGGTEITESSVFASAEPITLYAHWTRDSFTVTFNANGGTVSTTSMKGYCGQVLGTLPTPTRDYYTFNGWYTAKTGGNEVTETSVYETTTAVTLYAQWTQNPVSEWVKASEVPSDAQIVDQKYMYSLTSYKTSDKSSLSGWTKYDTTWEWGDYSDWSEWSETSATASDSQKVETRTVYEYGYFVCSACGAHWHGHSITCFTYAGGCGASNTIPNTSWISAYGTIPQSQMGFVDWYGTGHTYKYYTGDVYEVHGDGSCVNTYYNNVLVFRNNYGDNSLTLYRYCTRDKVYTYYFKKTESKESTTYPTGENISNIVEWVKYRAK